MADIPPLGPPAILTPPTGWLGFLGLKNGGKQPTGVSLQLSPTIDMDRFYRAGLRQLLFNNAALAAINNSTAVAATVPGGKVWLVEYISAFSDILGVAANVVAWLNFFQAGNTLMGVSQPNPQRALTGESVLLGLPGPAILLPGDSVGVYTSAASAPTAFNWHVRAVGIEVAA